MSGPFGSSQWMYEAGGDFYSTLIDNSLRFDGASKLTMTPPSASDRTKFTVSCWVKRSALGADQRLFEGWGGSTSNWTVISFDSGDSIQIQNRVSGSAVLNYVSSAKYRDVGAWYHIVTRFDLAGTGLKVWVNGTEVTQWAASTFSSANTFFNSSSYNINIGYYQGTATQYLQGHLANVDFVDNQALSATDFGEYDGTGTIWRPKEYTGSYGTNGFHLKFDAKYGFVEDMVGNYDGTNHGASLVYDSAYGDNVASFDGVNDYMNIDSGPTLGTTRTLSFWAKDFYGQVIANPEQYGTTNYASSFFCSVDSTTGQVRWITDKYNGSTYGGVYFDSSYSADGNWHHFVLTCNGTTYTGYMDGVALSPSADQTGITPRTDSSTSLTNTRIARRPGTTAVYSSGYLSNIKIYNRAVSSAEASSLYAKEDVTDGILAHYPLNSSIEGFKDYSGNENTFASSSAQTTDVMLDSPTNNFCTINPLKIGSVTLSEGNLQHQHTGSTSWRGVTPTMHVSSGKWYWEVAFSNLYTPPASTTRALVGIVSENETQTNVTAATYWTGITAEAYGYFNYDGSIYNNNSGTAYGSTWGNATIGIALDLDSSPKTLEFFLNGVSQGVLQDGTHINLGDKAWGPGASTYYSSIASYNFGQFDFTYTPPSDFLPLSSVNLPTPTFDPKQGASPQDGFNVYTDTGANILSTAQGDYSDGLFWIKDYQNPSTDHQLLNTVTNTVLESNTTDAERAYSIPSGSSVAWAWKANGAGVSNTDGTITSTVSANQKAGFSIVSYTGTGANATVGHGLGVVPAMVIAKKRDAAAGNWAVHHKDLTDASYYLWLNATAAQAVGTNIWNSTAPSSSVFSIGTSSNTNTSSVTYIAYCFAEVEGYSKFGSYTGNGSADGPFVYLGFRPAFIMIKRTSSIMNWAIEDTARSPSNVADDTLYPNLQDAQDSLAASSIDFLSNGFKLRNSAGGWINDSGSTFLYMAFAEQPFKYANAR